jgi:hypothetical protein
VLQDLRDKLVLENGVLRFPKLEVGYYVLTTFEPYKSIIIRVLEGNYWKKTDLIVANENLVDLKQKSNQLVLTNVQFKQVEEQTAITASYSNSNQIPTRVHAVALQFLPQGKIDDLARRFQERFVT